MRPFSRVIRRYFKVRPRHIGTKEKKRQRARAAAAHQWIIHLNVCVCMLLLLLLLLPCLVAYTLHAAFFAAFCEEGTQGLLINRKKKLLEGKFAKTILTSGSYAYLTEGKHIKSIPSSSSALDFL